MSDAEATEEPAGIAPPEELPEWLSLDAGEEVQWVGQPAPVSMVPAVLWGIPLTLVFGLGILIIVWSYLTVTHTDFVVTNTTIYHKRGVLSTNIETVGLDRVQNTEFSQSFSGKQLGYGNIEISTAGSAGADVTFRAIENPSEVRELVNKLTGGAASRREEGGEAAPTAGGDAELLSELLTELRAVNESMANVERLLRADAGPGSAADARRSTTGRRSEAGGADEGTSRTEDSAAAGGRDGSAPGAGSGAADDPSEGSTGRKGSPESDGATETDESDDDEDPPTPFGGDE